MGSMVMLQLCPALKQHPMRHVLLTFLPINLGSIYSMLLSHSYTLHYYSDLNNSMQNHYSLPKTSFIFTYTSYTFYFFWC